MDIFGILGVGTPELLVIFLIVLVLFGAKKLPQLARGAGQSVAELKKGLKEGQPEPETAEANAAASGSSRQNANDIHSRRARV